MHSREFRMEVVRRILNGEKVAALSRELEIHRKVLYEWARRFKEGGESNLRDRGRPRSDEAAGRSIDSARATNVIAELQREAAQQRSVVAFLRICLAVSGLASDPAWPQRIFPAIEKAARTPRSLSVEIMCELAGVARSSYYRYLRTRGAQTGQHAADRPSVETARDSATSEGAPSE
jgi:transposase-like protein